MITSSQLTLAGKVNKTHGIGGEMSMSFFTDDILDAVEPDACLIFDIDGIFTPFFVSSVRPRSSEALLVKLDGIDSQEGAAPYVGKDIYMLSSLIADGEGEEDDEEDDADGFYAAQLIGFTAIDENGEVIGEIVDIDDSTDNALFILENDEDGNARQFYIPIVDEFITDISTKQQTITFDLPTGLLSI